jgi:hypothetical protein
MVLLELGIMKWDWEPYVGAGPPVSVGGNV